MTRTYLVLLSLIAVFLTAPVSADTIILDFNGSGIGDIRDSAGRPTGFTHRIPGSGAAIPANDPNLNVDTANGHLLMTSTRSDFNLTGFGRNLAAMEAPSIRLNNIGSDDFIVRARFLDVHVDQLSDQLGVFVGTSVDKVLRGGLHEMGPGTYQSGFVYSLNGVDQPPQGGQLSTFVAGQDAVVQIGRINGDWHFRWTNLDDPSKSGGLENVFVPGLDSETDLFFGVYNHDARNTTPQIAILDQFVILTGTSIPEPSAVMLSLGSATFWMLRRRHLAA